MKQKPGDMIILHYCTKNYDYRPYFSWDTVRNTCYFIFHVFQNYDLMMYSLTDPALLWIHSQVWISDTCSQKHSGYYHKIGYIQLHWAFEC